MVRYEIKNRMRSVQFTFRQNHILSQDYHRKFVDCFNEDPSLFFNYPFEHFIGMAIFAIINPEGQIQAAICATKEGDGNHLLKAAYTIPAARGQGLMPRLIDFAVTSLQKSGMVFRCFIRVLPKARINTASSNTFGKVGFLITGVRRSKISDSFVERHLRDTEDPDGRFTAIIMAREIPND